MLPYSEDPALVLQRIFPDLCLVGQSCHRHSTLIQRHTTGIGDRNLYYIRLFNHHGKLLAFSPNQPLPVPLSLNPNPWQTFRGVGGTRYHQFTIILHSANTHPKAEKNHDRPSWGYLQIGRTLAAFDAETNRIVLGNESQLYRFDRQCYSVHRQGGSGGGEFRVLRRHRFNCH